MDGAFIIDKPDGLTSHDVVARVRKIIGENFADPGQTTSELLKQVAGIEVIGPTPYHLQTAAVFSAGRMVASQKAEQSDRLLRFLASPEAAPALHASGLEP